MQDIFVVWSQRWNQGGCSGLNVCLGWVGLGRDAGFWWENLFPPLTSRHQNPSHPSQLAHPIPVDCKTLYSWQSEGYEWYPRTCHEGVDASGSRAPIFFTTAVEVWWSPSGHVVFTPYRGPPVPTEYELESSHSWSGCFREEKKALPLPGAETRFFGFIARSLSTLWATLIGS